MLLIEDCDVVVVGVVWVVVVELCLFLLEVLVLLFVGDLVVLVLLFKGV